MINLQIKGCCKGNDCTNNNCIRTVQFALNLVGPTEIGFHIRPITFLSIHCLLMLPYYDHIDIWFNIQNGCHIDLDIYAYLDFGDGLSLCSLFHDDHADDHAEVVTVDLRGPDTHSSVPINPSAVVTWLLVLH